MVIFIFIGFDHFILVFENCSDRGPVRTDALRSFASARCGPVGDIYLLGSESAIGAADGRAGAVVLAQCTVPAEVGLFQDGIDLALGVVCVRRVVGVWNRGGAKI